ncbi:MAG: hypothetical protein V7K92_18100 [Nostoc sp.]
MSTTGYAYAVLKAMHNMRALLHNSVVANIDKSGQNERMVNLSKTDFIK